MSSGLGRFGKLFGPQERPASVPAPAAQVDAEHGPVEDWFVRTAKMLLGKRGATDADGKPRRSPLELRLEALEKENATLRADNLRLADEVIALRTLIYVRGRKPAAPDT